MIDDLLAALWVHPQVHVEIGALSFGLPLRVPKILTKSFPEILTTCR